MKTKLNIMVILTLVLTLFGGGVTPANAATGDLDPTFGTNGRVDTGVNPWYEWFFISAPSVQQSDGSIIVGGVGLGTPAGNLGNGDDSPYAVLERYTADGVLDTSFGTDGRLYPQVEGSDASVLVGTHIGSQMRSLRLVDS